MTNFDDVPLPGLDLNIESRQVHLSPRREYSSTLKPTEEAVKRFWSRVVHSPDCALWVGAISGGDGYGRDRAELHLFGYSTSV